MSAYFLSYYAANISTFQMNTSCIVLNHRNYLNMAERRMLYREYLLSIFHDGWAK